MDVGFIGVGRMGAAMARNLVRAGHRVWAWNRSPDAVRGLDGVTAVAAPADAFDADVVFTMLSDDAAIRTVVLERPAFANARPGVVHVVTSTISIAFADELAAAHRAAGVAYLSAPVFGRPDVAESAQLNILAAGDAAAIAKVQPLFDVLGRKTWRLGDEPRQANAAKIAGNMMIAMAIEAMAEAVVLTGEHGVPAGAFMDLMLGTLFSGRVYENYGAKIVKADYDPGFTMKLGLKDLRLATAGHAGGSLPMLDAVRERMAQAVDAGMGERDWSAIAAFAQGGST